MISQMCEISVLQELQPACALEPARLVCLCGLFQRLQLSLDLFSCQSVLGELCLNALFYPGVLNVPRFCYINDEISLQPPRAEEALHGHSIVQRACVASPRLLMILFAVHAHCIDVDGGKLARPAPQPIQRLPKLFYHLRGLVWELHVGRVDCAMMTEALDDQFSSCSGHAVMLQEMRVEIDDRSVMRLAHQRAKVFQKAENIVAVVERHV